MDYRWNYVKTSYEDFIEMLLVRTEFVDEQNLSITRNENDGSILVNVPISAGKKYQVVAFELPDPSNLSDSYDCVSYIQGNGSGYSDESRQLYISEMRNNNPNTIGIFSTSFSNPEVPDRIDKIRSYDYLRLTGTETDSELRQKYREAQHTYLEIKNELLELLKIIKKCKIIC